MDFAFSPADEHYRQQVRQWLVEHHPGTPLGPHGSAAWLQWARSWQRRAYEAGYVGLGWPQQYGGVAGSLTWQVILTQELVRARAPQFVGQMGLRMLGPTLLHYGSEAQDSKYVVDDGMWQYEHMYTRGLIIGGGTSQIQKNIISERALGLPK